MKYDLNSENSRQIGWGGLWWHPENQNFSSQIVSIDELKKFKNDVKIIIKRNKYYDKDKKRPNYSFCIREVNDNKKAEKPLTGNSLEQYSTDELLNEIKRRIEK